MRATPSRAARFLFRKKRTIVVVARNSLFHSCLAVFRVAVSSTLKTVNYLIFSYFMLHALCTVLIVQPR